MSQEMKYYGDYKRLAAGSTCTAIGQWQPVGWFKRLLLGKQFKRYCVVYKGQQGFWDKPTELFWGGYWEYSNEPH